MVPILTTTFFSTRILNMKIDSLEQTHTAIIPYMIHRISMIMLMASVEKNPMIPPIIMQEPNATIIQMLIYMPLPPILQAFE